MRRAVLLGGVAVASGVAVAAGLIGTGGDDSGRAAADEPGRTSAQVERRTLVSRELVSGTLGYADERSVRVRADSGGGASGASAGTVTAVVREGATLRRGQALYRIDGEAVRLLVGDTPAWRTMQQGDEGRDVKALEHNLVKLGYDPGKVDGDYDGETVDAVLAWQEDVGWDETGSVTLGQVVFQPGLRRAGEVRTKTGDLVAANAEILRTTSRRRQVDVDLDADQQTLARTGAEVEVTLPGGERTGGRVTRVGTVAHGPERESDDGEDVEATVSVTIRLDREASAGRLDGAPVSVGLAAEISTRVLTVPVTALLALPGGGYAVQVAGDGSSRTVRVTVGQFADGLVEVRGRGLGEGDRVVVPDGL